MKGIKQMGIANAPWYGEDLGSAIETAEAVIARIKSNKYDATDLTELAEVLETIRAEVAKNEN